MCGLSSLVRSVTEHKTPPLQPPHMHARSPPRGKNPAEKAAYLLPKKAVYLSCQKGSLPLLPKMAAYRKKKKQEEEAEKEDEEKTKEEAEEEQKRIK